MILEAVLTFVIALLVTALGFASYYLWKFAKIIMIFEDDIDETIESLKGVEGTIVKVINMQMFFDSPEIQKEVKAILDEIKLCRAVINKTIGKFTARSKQKYTTVWYEEDDNLNAGNEQSEQRQIGLPQLPGQPPWTPNPLAALQREGMILDVRHENK